MKYQKIHDFNITDEKELLAIQHSLRTQIVKQDMMIEPKIVSGFDAAYTEQYGIGVLVTVSYPDLKTLEVAIAHHKVGFDYISGFLAFRELPIFLTTWKKASVEPDVVLFDGHGYAHPRRMGLATHASFFIQKPTIGVAKKNLIGTFKEPKEKKGAYEYIYDDNEIIGAVLRSQTSIKPIYVSVGNFISLKTALEIVLNTIRKNRLPEPLARADKIERQKRKEQL